MNKCPKCFSEEIEIQYLSFEDLHKILKVFICKRCGNKDDLLVDLQEV
jgi:hypothetical protein